MEGQGRIIRSILIINFYTIYQVLSKTTRYPETRVGGRARPDIRSIPIINFYIIYQVLSKDYKISGDEGWWTGKCAGKVGVFPCNFVAPCDLDFSNLSKETIEPF